SSTYCGLPQHQALSRFSTSHVDVLSGLGDAEIATLADPDSDDAEVTAIVQGAEADFVEPSEEVAEAEVEETVEVEASEEGETADVGNEDGSESETEVESVEETASADGESQAE